MMGLDNPLVANRLGVDPERPRERRVLVRVKGCRPVSQIVGGVTVPHGDSEHEIHEGDARFWLDHVSKIPSDVFEAASRRHDVLKKEYVGALSGDAAARRLQEYPKSVEGMVFEELERRRQMNEIDEKAVTAASRAAFEGVEFATLEGAALKFDEKSKKLVDSKK